MNNPLAIPTLWQIDYLTLHVENPTIQANLKLGVEVVPSANSLIVYGFFNNARTRSNKSVVLLISNGALGETPAGNAIDPAQIQYLAADPSNANPRWKTGLGPYAGTTEDYFDTQIDCVSGFTVRWNSILSKWQVIGANSQYAAMQVYPKGNPYTPIPYARIFLHPTAFGPFLNSPQASNCYFYTFTELNSRDPTLYCYTARQWQDANDPRYNTDANILLTYTFSSRDVNKQLIDASMYQNTHVLLANPYSGSPTNPTACGATTSPRDNTSKSSSTAPDPFFAPSVPQPLPFPTR